MVLYSGLRLLQSRPPPVVGLTEPAGTLAAGGPAVKSRPWPPAPGPTARPAHVDELPRAPRGQEQAPGNRRYSDIDAIRLGLRDPASRLPDVDGCSPRRSGAPEPTTDWYF